MSRYFGIVVIFPCLLILIYMISFLNYKAEARREILTIRANAAADRATEAALIESQLNAHVDSYGTTIINPEYAWQAYRTVFLKSFNTGGQKVEAMMDAWVPAMLIAVNDGYYLRMITSDGTTYQMGANPNSVMRYRFSQKIPFARVIGGEYVADTLNGAYIYSYTQGFGAQVKGIHTPVDDTPGGIHDSRAIVGELVGAMSYMVELANDHNNKWTSQFYLPRQFLDNTLYSAVTYKGMTVMCLIQGFDLLSHDKLDVHSIAASQMVNPNHHTLNPKKVKISQADHLALTEQMKTLEPDNTDGVCLMLLNYGPSCDYDIKNGKVYLHNGWVETK